VIQHDDYKYTTHEFFEHRSNIRSDKQIVSPLDGILPCCDGMVRLQAILQFVFASGYLFVLAGLVSLEECKHGVCMHIYQRLDMS